MKLVRIDPKTVLAQVLTTAGRGTREVVLSWRRPQLAGRAKKSDNGVLHEFRSKMRMAEDLISKLAFSLREIQGERSLR